MVFLREGAEQCAIADDVDHARHAVRKAMDLAQRRRREGLGSGAGDAHAVLHVRRGLAGGQRVQVIAARDALCQLPQFRLVEQVAQLRLPDQDDLQQLRGRRLEVREQPHLFERLRAQVLRLVHDQHDATAAGVRVEQVAAEHVHQDLGAAASRLGNRHVQFLADREQELGRRDAGVQDQRDVRVARQLLEQAADHGGLARADLARELDEPARLVDAVQQVRERLGMPLAEVQVAGVRRDRERLFLETEKARVHAELDGSEAQGWAANDACPGVAWLAAPAYPVRLLLTSGTRPAACAR